MQKVLRVILAGLVASTLSTQADDWPAWRGPDHNGISRESNWAAKWPADGPKRLWKAKTGMGFASISVAGGRACTTGNSDDKDTVYGFDAKTGKELWKFSYPAKLDAMYYEGGTSATPTIDGDRVFTLSKRGWLHCLDATNGTVLWSTNVAEALKAAKPTWGFSSSVLIEGDLALINIGDGGAALDKKSGKLVWASGPEECGYSTPVPFSAGADRAAAIAGKSDFKAVRVSDGKELWRFNWQTEYDVNAADPIVSSDRVFVSSGYNRGSGLFDLTDRPPRVLWENTNMRNHFNPCVLVGDSLVGFDGGAGEPEATLKCLDFKTGNVRWEQKTGFGGLIAANGKLIVITEKGELIVAEASPKEFKPLARAQVIGGKCWTAPTLANGRIYCRNSVGEVVCVDVSGK